MAKLNVAIADDNERILTLLDDILTAEEDINVVGTAKDGEETCRLIRDKEPDVVLLDLVMPRIDGLGVMDRIKHDRNVKKMPSFIIVSGITKEPVPEDAPGVPWHSLPRRTCWSALQPPPAGFWGTGAYCTDNLSGRSGG